LALVAPIVAALGHEAIAREIEVGDGAQLGRRDEILCYAWTALKVLVPEPRGRSLRRSRRARYVDVRPLGASVNRYLDAGASGNPGTVKRGRPWRVGGRPPATHPLGVGFA
jgi:hypothetical protein